MKMPIGPRLRLGNTSNITDAPLQAPMMEQEQGLVISRSDGTGGATERLDG